jgi:catalase
MEDPRDALNSMYAILGIHPGCRAGHAKGTFCTGKFTPTERANDLTKAPHMQRETVDVTVRFSNQTGDPDRHDGASRLPRGMATRFHLPGGEYTDLIAISLPRFTNRTPRDFGEMNRSCFRRKKTKSGKHKTALRPIGTLRFLLRHPESRKGFWASFRTKPIPSYANCRYNSLNAFMWSGENPETHEMVRSYVRYSWMPEDGQKSLKASAAKKLPPDFLQRDLYDRLGRKPPRPIRFWLEVQIASQEDLKEKRVDDPTSVWPKEPARIVPALQERKPGEEPMDVARFVTVGVLELTGLMTEAPPGDVPSFDPMNLTDGIDPSDDEILHFRHDVYELAASERKSGEYPETL